MQAILKGTVSLAATFKRRGVAQYRGSILAYPPTSPGSFPSIQKNFRGKIIDVSEVNQRCWLEEIGQWLENVDRTRLVLASGKPVLQKSTEIFSIGQNLTFNSDRSY